MLGGLAGLAGRAASWLVSEGERRIHAGYESVAQTAQAVAADGQVDSDEASALFISPIYSAVTAGTSDFARGVCNGMGGSNIGQGEGNAVCSFF